MKNLNSVWLTIDTDDIFHHPKFQGHPTRSRKNAKENSTSKIMKYSIEQFEKWHLKNIKWPITIFVIGEQLECSVFKSLLNKLLKKSQTNGGKITIGCHGYSHRCWSAFNPDKQMFEKEIIKGIKIIKNFAGDLWRPWFRSPGGYVAPWMAEILKKMGFVLDSSINPTKFLSMKSGKSNKITRYNGWNSVHEAMREVNIIERPWLTIGYPALPACGPALHIPILKYFAKTKWKKITNGKIANEEEILNSKISINTVYWHLLDHSKNNGNWMPPIMKK